MLDNNYVENFSQQIKSEETKTIIQKLQSIIDRQEVVNSNIESLQKELSHLIRDASSIIKDQQELEEGKNFFICFTNCHAKAVVYIQIQKLFF